MILFLREHDHELNASEPNEMVLSVARMLQQSSFEDGGHQEEDDGMCVLF